MMHVEHSNHENLSTEIEAYLINNYREALRKGDKSSAKSCLLAARYFSVNDQDVTNEIYLMAKADGDVVEASKCYAKIFNDLFLNEDKNSKTSQKKALTLITSHEKPGLEIVREQMKEETKLLLADLELRYLNLKSDKPLEVSSTSPDKTLLFASPIPSLRNRMHSVESRDSKQDLANNQLSIYNQPSSQPKSFYQQLFDNLPEETKKNILKLSIENAFEENSQLEVCRQMMLCISIFNETVTIYGSRLLKILIELSSQDNESSNSVSQDAESKSSSGLSQSETSSIARNLLVLDVMPLVLGIAQLDNLEITPELLLDRILIYYSAQFLSPENTEYAANELHEGMKKSIAARIIGIEHKLCSDLDTREDHLLSTLRFINQKLLDLTINDNEMKKKLTEIRTITTDKYNWVGKFDKVDAIIKTLELKGDMPDEVLFSRSEPEVKKAATPPPVKGRGRPKKSNQATSVIVSLDEGVRQHIEDKGKKYRFIFYTLVEMMFVIGSRYLKSMRSKILISPSNQLLSEELECELNSTASQRGSRGKGASKSKESDTSGSSSPTKRIKLDEKMTKLLSYSSKTSESPLNSEQAKSFDIQTLVMLKEYMKFKEFIESCNVFNRLWDRFIKTTKLDQELWFRRINIDGNILSNHLDLAISEIEKFETDYDREDQQCQKNTRKPEDSNPDTDIAKTSQKKISCIRLNIQAISCYLQIPDKESALKRIDELITKMGEIRLLANDTCPYENALDECIIYLQSVEHQPGLLLFDTISILRYCINILRCIHKRYTYSSKLANDITIGHAIVLSQFDWPKESHLYDYCISWIRTHKPKSTTPQTLSASTKFTYPDFFLYIRNQNIIEDFMAFLNNGYTLDIRGSTNTSGSQTRSSSGTGTGSQTSSTASKSQSSTTSTRSSKAITTRGVNKSFKEDLKVALISQMKNSTIVIPFDLVARFIQDSLIPYIESSKK